MGLKPTDGENKNSLFLVYSKISSLVKGVFHISGQDCVVGRIISGVITFDQHCLSEQFMCQRQSSVQKISLKTYSLKQTYELGYICAIRQGS